MKASSRIASLLFLFTALPLIVLGRGGFLAASLPGSLLIVFILLERTLQWKAKKPAAPG